MNQPLIIKSILLIIAFGLALNLSAQQNFSISGRVSDRKTGELLPGATVLIQNSGIGVTTDMDGNFEINVIKQARITLIASYIGYQSDTVSHDFNNNKRKVLNIKLQPVSTMLEQVNIEGTAEGQVQAMIRQKEAENIINVVSEEQISQFPDMNAAEAIQRIPGITLQRDQGEGKYVQLRGTPPELTNFNINGEQIPSPEGGVRYVGMDVISADQIEQIEITKVLTPDMDGDGIGGTVNIITKKASGDKPEINATLAGGYSDLRQTPNYRAQFSYGSRYGKFGIHFNGSYYVNKYGSDNMEFVYAKGPLWGSTGDSIDNYYVHYREFQLRYYDITRTRVGLSATLDYEFNKNSFVYLRGMFNNFTDNETRRRKIYTLDDPLSQKYYLYGGIDHDLKAREKIQNVNTLNAGGEHKLNNGITVDYEIAYAFAGETQPDRIETRFESPGQAIAIKFDLSDPDYPRPYFPDPNNANNAYDYDNYEMDELQLQSYKTSDENITAKINLKIPYTINEHSGGYIKFGGKTRSKHKERDIRSIDYGAYHETSNIYPGEGPKLSLATINDGFYEPALMGQENYTLEYMPSETKMRDFYEFYPQFFIIDRDGTRASTFNEDYLADEDIYAAYAMVRHDFDKLMLLGGLRYEKTKIYYEGREPILDSYGHYLDVDTISDSRTQDFILPQFQMKYSFNEQFNLRAAMTYTFSRPNFEDVIPYREEDRDQVKYGNPDLNFPKSMNLDLLAEKYLLNAGIISGGLFYKNIDNFIFFYKTYAHEGSIESSSLMEITIPLNGNQAKVYGAELQYQSKLSFLSGYWSDFGVYVNYTFTESEAYIAQRKPANYSDAVINWGEDFLPQVSIEGEEKIKLPGQSKHAANLALFYDNGIVYAKLSANYHDTFLYELGADKDLDEYYGEAWHLDFTTHYSVNENLKFFVDVVNLLNTPLKYYLGANEELIKKQEFYSWTARLGVKLSF